MDLLDAANKGKVSREQKQEELKRLLAKQLAASLPAGFKGMAPEETITEKEAAEARKKSTLLGDLFQDR